MKILFIKEKRSPSGIEGVGIYLLNICKELTKKKIEFLVLYNCNDQYYEMLLSNNIPVRLISFPEASVKNLVQPKMVKKGASQIENIVKNEGITHINVHFPYLLNFVKTNWRVPIIAHQHGAVTRTFFSMILSSIKEKRIKNIIKILYKKYFVFNFNKADLIVCAGKDAYFTTTSIYGAEPSRILIDMYGVPNKIKEGNHQQVLDIRKKYNIKEGQKVVISVGRETLAKGVEDFCEVAKLLSKHKYKFIFLGGYRDKQYHEYLVRKYQDYVTFAGMQLDTTPFYKMADLVLFLSHREAGGMTLMEAANFSLPAIIWNVIGVREIITDNYNGYVCTFGDIKEAADRVNKILSDDNVKTRLSNAAYNEYQEKFKINLHVEKLIESFEKL